ncbi:Very-short-patch-repair endonuclease [Priestia aryabhattai B8W22]|uniref:endonuclease domain-containing protein n=1 Tax=Priestia aryabhattai TaxID=412384 RepID=UPI00088D88E9|nr:Very-short-patch-repair endonuclease [Priestia aryabhattai B8W22]
MWTVHTMEYAIFFLLLTMGGLAYIFYEMGPKPDPVSTRILEYKKLDSHIERRLYSALVNNGYKVRAQVRCGRYRIDLVIGDVAIECDGKKYHSSPERKARDRRKSAYLRKNGYRKVLRFTGSEIVTKMPDVIKRIEHAL